MTTDAGAGRLVAGRYQLRELLGQGGMGAVWLASDAVLGRTVAVKEVTFPPYLHEDERRQLRERTLREARAAARFEHPQVTTVHDVVEEDGRPWIVMEHVRSRTLAAVVTSDGPLPPQHAARAALDVLAALAAAHQAGIVHRDVKPANVLVDDARHAWLTDFGIATASGDPSMTTEGVLLGSPSYMAPERARGSDPEPASDLWSLGATLYYAVEGRPPFDRPEVMATLLALATEEPAPFRAAGPLEPVLRGLLVKDPRRRLTTDAARAALAPLAAGQVGQGSSPAPSPAARAGSGAPPRSVRDTVAAARARGERIERLDLGRLSELLATAATSTTRTAVRAAASLREPAVSAARDLAMAPAAAPAPEPRRPPPPQQRWRIPRRWIAVPLAILLVLLLGLVAVIGLAVWALDSAFSSSSTY
ncbi:MAG: serine/threonine protein kinase [Actinomycetota bacterium]|nr:serine/threonine protein kinase [Actinomycetota bacterium]